MRAFRQDASRWADEGNSWQFPLTQSVLGDALGLSNLHINRSLMGLIILEKHCLTIPNLES
jgi:hypothetical protein